MLPLYGGLNPLQTFCVDDGRGVEGGQRSGEGSAGGRLAGVVALGGGRRVVVGRRRVRAHPANRLHAAG